MVINMTNEEKLECYRAKQSFVSHIDFAFTTYKYDGYSESIGGCESVRYEAYQVTDAPFPYVREYVIMTYRGGAIAPKTVTANSLSAIMNDIAGLMYGGYYSEVEEYREFVKRAKEENGVVKLV